MLYESYIHPLTTMSGLPTAGLGALITIWLFGDELNIYSFVGLIMLIGIVEKNAIIQIDFALEAERRHNRTPAEAIYEGCVIRFRPIMMTTMAALCRWRTCRLAVADALPDAGDLHLHGNSGEGAQACHFLSCHIFVVKCTDYGLGLTDWYARIN